MRFRQSLFWDTDPKKIDKKKHAKYIIERILDFGTDDEVRWMSRNYQKKLINEVAIHSRVLRPETKNLWQLITQN